MSEKKLTKIGVKTEKNGYTLTVDGVEFFYFSEMDLLAGFLAHVGAGDTCAMDKGSILNSLFAAMIGETYTNSVTTLKKRVGLLTDQYETRINKMDETLEYVVNAQKTVDGLTKKLESLADRMTAVSEDCSKIKTTVTDTRAKWNNLEIYANKVLDATAKAAGLDKDDKKGKSKGKEEKAEKTAEKSPKKESKSKSKSSRAARDEQIIEALKKSGQLKD